MPDSWIVAMGGGAFAEEPENPLLHDYILSLAGKPDPRVCFVPTATGDAAALIARFYSIFARKPCRPNHLALILEPPEDVEGFVMEQDVIYASGGNTAVMLAAWRLHGLDRALERAFEAGKVFCGGSAGAICWHEGGTTDSFTRKLTPLTNGLGWVKGSFSPHYDAEPRRRPRFHEMVGAGELPDGIACDEGVAAVYRGATFVEFVSSRSKATAYRVERRPDGVAETSVEPRYLGPIT
jgi:peptidase E